MKEDNQALYRNGAAVKLDNGHAVRVSLCGRLMQRSIRVVVGDSIRTELTV